MASCVFAVDFSHENMTAGFVSLEGGEEGTAGFDLHDFVAGESKPLDKLVALLAAKSRAAPGEIEAVAVALSGEVDRERRKVVNFPQAPWLNGQPLAEILESVFSAPVILERRAIVSLTYDRVMLGLPEAGVTLGCYVDTHYETAIWHNGGFIVGRNGAAGNIAHITIHGREDNCFCGRMGCVDLYGAGVRLNQLHSMIFPDTPLAELFVRHGDHPIVEDYLSMMAYPIAVEANILDPDYIVLGGRIPTMRGFPRAVLERAVSDHRYRPDPGWETSFLASLASAESGVSCAAHYAMMRLGKL